MKKIVTVLLVLALITALFAGCSGSGAANKVLKIGIVQLVKHPALDAAYEGFVDGLKAEGFEDGKNISIDYQDAQGEQSNCNTIATKFVNDKCDLILAIATPAAQAAVNATTEIPIMVTAVTDPAGARIVSSNEAPGGNVTGTSDLNPIKEQIELLTTLVPNAKTVGMLYCSSEANSKIQVDLAKAELDKYGIGYQDFTVSSTNEIQPVVESMKGKVDVVYAPTDNMIASGMSAVAAVANEAGLPVIVAEPNMVENGGLATYGLNYFNLGKQTGTMAAKVLRGESKPADMPIEYLSQADLIINQKTADALGMTIPQELADKAQIVK